MYQHGVMTVRLGPILSDCHRIIHLPRNRMGVWVDEVLIRAEEEARSVRRQTTKDAVGGVSRKVSKTLTEEGAQMIGNLVEHAHCLPFGIPYDPPDHLGPDDGCDLTLPDGTVQVKGRTCVWCDCALIDTNTSRVTADFVTLAYLVPMFRGVLIVGALTKDEFLTRGRVLKFGSQDRFGVTYDAMESLETRLPCFFEKR